MRDLDLFDGDPSPEALTELASWPLVRRAPYLGRVRAALDHPELREAALRALVGARGMEAVRAIVRGLAEPALREVALEGLRAIAREAPDRYAHAIFHPDVEVRRAALAELAPRAAGLAIYLRADPACADLTTHAAWPAQPLPIAFDLYVAGQLRSVELLEVLFRVSLFELRTFLAREQRRSDEQVASYLASLERAPAITPAPGRDLLDRLLGAVVDVFDRGTPAERVLAERALAERVMGNPKHASPATRSLAASVLTSLATATGPARTALLALAIVLEPWLLAAPCVRAFPELVDAAIHGLLRYRWPIKLTKKQIARLLADPLVAGDLALATAVVGFGNARLKTLAKALGEDEIVRRLIASDRGWDQLLRLPAETPARELAWLARVEQASVPRYLALAAHALGVLRDRRLFAFVDQLPRRHRAGVVIAFASTPVDDDQLTAVIAAFAPRLDRAGAAEILGATAASAPALARALSRGLSDKLLGSAIAAVDDAAVLALLASCDGPEALPRDRELAVARALVGRAHPELQAWVARVLAPPVEAAPVVVPRQASALDEPARHAISTCPEAELAAALAPALRGPAAGLAAALGERAAAPSVHACVALLGCVDPVEHVARELDRFADQAPRFLTQLEVEVVRAWNAHAELPPLAHARLFRWEAHALAFARWVDETGGVLPALMAATALPGVLAAQTLWAGIAEVVMLWRYREPARLARDGNVDLARYCASRVDRPSGRSAARILVALVEGKLIGLSAIRAILLERTADADAETRELLARLIRLDGMPEPPPRLDRGMPTAELLDAIRSCRDLAELARWCADPRRQVVEEAAMTLLVHGDLGQLRLAQLLRELDALPCPLPILASIVLWDSAPARFAARELAARELPPQWQFHVHLGLGDPERALEAVLQPGSWFTRADWEALSKVLAPRRCALELAACSHHHAYTRAVELLLAEPAADPVRDALVRFLEVEAPRPLELRRAVARHLYATYGVERGLPLLVEELLELESIDEACALFAPATAARVAQAIVDAALIGGHDACSEQRMWAVVMALRPRLPVELAGAFYLRVLEEAMTAPVRRQASQLVVGEALRAERLTRVAEVFAWGIRRGVELTGRMFRVHLTSKETDLGHTFLDGNRIFVSPLPLLRGEPDGQDIVEGLLLHEIGHHAYHRGELPQALWKRAHDQGIGHLLNLLADEHLERNLRGVDRSYGDRLKRLDAFAFQHGAHELRVATLLEALRGSAATALIRTPLEVAFDEASVRLRRGAVLAELERAGHPLARFARALRMGLGNRTGDPLVSEALARCGPHLRKLDMQGLYDLTVELAELFGGAVAIARVFGGPEGIEFGERDDDVWSGLDDEVLQREIERVLDPRRGKSGTPGGRDRLCVNVNPDEHFDKITHVVRVQGNPEAHRATALAVARHAHRLRAFLDELGVRWVPQHARIQGRALDRTRLRGLVTRGDPRILVAREAVRRTDLFLGTLIDCSGSMAVGGSLERAQRFATLIAEAVRPLAGVEARFFGFTDSTIFDAGDARACGVSGLETSGGNNDAAALLHAANAAAGSTKRAKVLVMISDGLPTECSVAALRGLVTTLTRRKGMVCAQVAVRPLAEECFPHHVVLDDAEPDAAVARFGRMIADLARRGLVG